MYIVINHISIVVVKIIDTRTMDPPRDIQLEFFEYNKNRTRRYVFLIEYVIMIWEGIQ